MSLGKRNWRKDDFESMSGKHATLDEGIRTPMLKFWHGLLLASVIGAATFFMRPTPMPPDRTQTNKYINELEETVAVYTKKNKLLEDGRVGLQEKIKEVQAENGTLSKQLRIANETSGRLSREIAILKRSSSFRTIRELKNLKSELSQFCDYFLYSNGDENEKFVYYKGQCEGLIKKGTLD